MGLLAAWTRGPLRDSAYVALGATLAMALIVALAAFWQPAGTALTPRNLVPPAAPSGAVPAVPELTAPLGQDARG